MLRLIEASHPTRPIGPPLRTPRRSASRSPDPRGCRRGRRRGRSSRAALHVAPEIADGANTFVGSARSAVEVAYEVFDLPQRKPWVGVSQSANGISGAIPIGRPGLAERRL